MVEIIGKGEVEEGVVVVEDVLKSCKKILELSDERGSGVAVDFFEDVTSFREGDDRDMMVNFGSSEESPDLVALAGGVSDDKMHDEISVE